VRWRPPLLVACTAILGPFVGGACSGAHDGARPQGTVVRVTERDFTIHVPPRIAAGDVRLVVHNRGPDMHELIVVRTSAAHLPLRPDAATVDEDGLEPLTVGTLEPGPPGSVRELDLRLRPGRYEVFCDMAGHYLGGMSAAFTVE
jgi:uncharacterized cupredoxin-like copper-binding protein